MKKLSISLLFMASLVFLNSCGISHAYVFNHNQNATQVHLGSNNFKVLEKVSGTAEVSYVLIFGGVNRKELYKNAYSEMVNSANLVSGSKALVNVLIEEHLGGVPPFYYTRTITVSANVVEFVK